MRDYRQLYSRVSYLDDFDKRVLLREVFSMFQACEKAGYDFRPEEFFTMVHENLNKKLVRAATNTRQTNKI